MPAARRWPRRLRDAACGLGALAVALTSAVPFQSARIVAAGVVAAAAVAEPAQARSRSSGGYSRPSSGGYSRPSMSSPAPSRRPSASPSYSPRAPSTSGGYSRPQAPSGGGWAPRTPSTSSGGDAAISRRQSVDALQNYRADQERLRQDQQRYERPPARVDAPPPSTAGGRTWQYRPYDRYDDWQRDRAATYRERGWSAPAYAYRSSPSFGVWDGLMLWFLLDNLSRPGSLDFFHNHRDDPGVAAWRSEAERLSRDNAALRGKLQDLDSGLARQADRPVDPAYMPPGVNPAVALAPQRAVAPQPEPASSGMGGMLLVVVIGGAVLLFLWYRRRQSRDRGAEGGEAMARRPAGEFHRPAPFRLGMTFDLDPTPFILVQGKTKVTPPDGDGARTSVEALGALATAGAVLHRLYLPGGRSFLQVHLDADDNPDECRYFSRIDAVRPASNDEWGFWIDDAEGMIGWPKFETKDGAGYWRMWSPGEQRVAPVAFDEERQSVHGTVRAHHQMMLYGAAIEAPPPAPQNEYILLDMIEAEDGAQVEIYAGIDVNPATLRLA
ncbi:MAG: DUF2491 family protein [Rhodospirillales bacterium]